MWIVRLALRRPYTFVVMAILIAILGGTAIVTMPVDIFPYIDIPIVSVLWQYSGLSPEEMEKRVVTNFERGLTSNVNDIEHIESQSYNSIAVVRIYFHPNVKIDMAVAQVTAQMDKRRAQHAARDVSRQRSEVRRRQRSGPATGPFQQDPARAGDLRSRRTTSSARRSAPCRAPPSPIRSAERTGP